MWDIAKKIAAVPQAPFSSVNMSARWKSRIIEKCRVITARSALPAGLWRPAAVQHVGKASVQPRLTRDVIVLWVDGLIVHMGVVTPEARDLLNESSLDVRHEVFVAPIPQFIAIADRAQDTAAGRLHGVVGHQFR